MNDEMDSTIEASARDEQCRAVGAVFLERASLLGQIRAQNAQAAQLRIERDQLARDLALERERSPGL